MTGSQASPVPDTYHPLSHRSMRMTSPSRSQLAWVVLVSHQSPSHHPLAPPRCNYSRREGVWLHSIIPPPIRRLVGTLQIRTPIPPTTTKQTRFRSTTVLYSVREPPAALCWASDLTKACNSATQLITRNNSPPLCNGYHTVLCRRGFHSQLATAGNYTKKSQLWKTLKSGDTHPNSAVVLPIMAAPHAPQTRHGTHGFDSVVRHRARVNCTDRQTGRLGRVTSHLAGRMVDNCPSSLSCREREFSWLCSVRIPLLAA